MAAGPPTPQVPSAQYDIQPCDPAKVYYVSLKGGQFLTFTGAASSCRIDYPGYDGTVYRDIIDANTLGRAPQDITKVQDPLTETEAPSVLEAGTGDILLNVTESTIVGPVPDQIATMMEQNDPFTHTAPRMEVSARTLMLWYDAITMGTPNTIPLTAKIVGRCWSDRYQGDSNAAVPQTIGSVPPVFVPAT